MIRNKLIIAYLLPTILLLMVAGGGVYVFVEDGLEAALGERLQAVAQTSVGGMPDSEPARIGRLTKDDKSTLDRMRRKLIKIRDVSGVKRVFLADPATHQCIVDTQDGTVFGDKLFDMAADVVELERVQKEQVAASSVMFTDKDGEYFKKGYAPVLLDGKVVAVVGVEGSAAYFSTLTQVRKALIGLLALTLLSTVLVSMWFSRSMTRPIDTLVAASHRYGEGRFEEPVVMDRKDEFDTLANAFNEMRAALLDRDEQMQMMLHGIAHEVRNPLGGMELFSGLLSEEVEPGSDQAEYVAKIQKELGYLTRVVNAFLEYARKPQLEWQRIGAETFLSEIVGLLMWDFEGVSQSLHMEEGLGDLELTADKDRLKQMLINFARNAMQASEAGARCEMDCIDASESLDTALKELLADYTVEKEVQRPTDRSGVWRLITVADQGKGMDQETLDQVFTPFFTTKEKGSGLGLALAQKTVEAHGGGLWVASNAEGKTGTIVVVGLPFRDEIEAAQPDIPEGWLG